MKIDNPFDAALSAQKNMPTSIRNASVYVTDTLDLAWKAVQAVFEEAAKPEHAIALLPVLLEQAATERRERLAERNAQRDA